MAFLNMCRFIKSYASLLRAVNVGKRLRFYFYQSYYKIILTEINLFIDGE